MDRDAENDARQLHPERDMHVQSQFLPVHLETDRFIASSLRITTSAGLLTLTSSYTLVRGKVLIAVLQGRPDDLEWTRQQIADWTRALVALNPP